MASPRHKQQQEKLNQSAMYLTETTFLKSIHYDLSGMSFNQVISHQSAFENGSIWLI